MKYRLFTILLLAAAHSPNAQELAIDSASVAEIQQRAIRHVRQFEGLLNVLAQPDTYFREYNYRELIRDCYAQESEYRIFLDSLVMIENDLNPEPQPSDSFSLELTIREYLQDFFTHYEKSPVASVFFSNYDASPLRQEEFDYVQVMYTSEFAGQHQAISEETYPLRKRIATVRVQPEDDGWQLYISDIRTARPDAATSGEELKNTFSELRRVYQPGKAYSLPLQINAETPPSSLILYRDNQQVEDLTDVLADSSFTWQVPNQIDRGDGYQLRLYDPITQETIESAPFIIRRRFP